MSDLDNLISEHRNLEIRLAAIAQTALAKKMPGIADDVGQVLESLSRITAGLKSRETPIKTPPGCLDVGPMRIHVEGFGEACWWRDLLRDIQGDDEAVRLDAIGRLKLRTNGEEPQAGLDIKGGKNPHYRPKRTAWSR